MTTAKLTRDAALLSEPLPDWMTHGACTAPETRGLPWTSDSDTVPDVLVDMMRDTCASCPVRLACAGYAMSQPVTGGWWAGLDRDPHPGPIKQCRHERATPEPLPRAVPIYNRAGELIDHQLVLFSFGEASRMDRQEGAA